MFIKREISSYLLNLSKQFPVIAIMGPRQSGKSTLAKKIFSDYEYVTLEDIDKKILAKEDPKYFLLNFLNKKGVIIDEIQEVPELFSYLQGIVDQENKPGYFIITGSQNFILYEKITQTLAGRIALLNLLPLTINELKNQELLPQTLDDLILKGFYPRLYSQNIDINIWFSNYISTYVEKDVRQILNVNDILSFQRFIKLCAARVGSILNYADLARDCDISPNTAKAWISVLESSYIIKLLQPYYKNFNKRLIKSPKLYFYDTGLVCTLLGIKNVQDLQINPLRGSIFESFIISEFFKFYFNKGQNLSLYFWRDVQGHEIDCLIEKSLDNIIPIEIKSRMTISDDFFKKLMDFQNITSQKDSNNFIVYAGDSDFKTKKGNIISWLNIYKFLETII